MFHVKQARALGRPSSLFDGGCAVRGVRDRLERVVDSCEGAAEEVARPPFEGFPIRSLSFDLVGERDGRQEHGLGLGGASPGRDLRELLPDDPGETLQIGFRGGADDPVVRSRDPQLDGATHAETLSQNRCGSAWVAREESRQGAKSAKSE